MRKIILANKAGGVYHNILRRIEQKVKRCRKSYLAFPDVFQVICSAFALSKPDAWEVLFILRDLSFIEIVPCHGIRLNYKIEDEKQKV